MSDQRNLILAIVLSVGIILAFQFFYEMPRMREAQQRQAAQQAEQAATADRRRRRQPPPGEVPGVAVPARGAGTAHDPGRGPGAVAAGADRQRRRCTARSRSRAAGSTTSPWPDYRETVDPNSPEIVLLSPPGSAQPLLRRVWLGRRRAGACRAGPRDACGTAEGGAAHRQATPVTLRWDNGQGLSFAKRVELDPDYMFTVRRSVTNSVRPAGDPLPLRPDQPLGHAADAGLLHPARGPDRRPRRHAARSRTTTTSPTRARSSSTAPAAGSGITDKYWLASLVPQQDLAAARPASATRPRATATRPTIAATP